MCSNPGQEMITQDIKENGLTRVVVAACSPRMHEGTFRKAVERGGINPYFLEMANIREQCSWVHDDPVAATEKAKALAHAAVERVKYHEPLDSRSVADVPRHAGDRRRHHRTHRRSRAGRCRSAGLSRRTGEPSRRQRGAPRPDRALPRFRAGPPARPDRPVKRHPKIRPFRRASWPSSRASSATSSPRCGPPGRHDRTRCRLGGGLHRLQGIRRLPHRSVRLRPAARRHHLLRTRGDAPERAGRDQGRASAALRLHHSLRRFAAATTSTPTARASAA